MAEACLRSFRRTFLVRLGLLLLVWAVLVTVFAGQFYWMGKGLPVEISWKQSFLHTGLEWAPWLVLSPLVVWLAERFRFDSTRWLARTLPHLPACVLLEIPWREFVATNPVFNRASLGSHANGAPAHA